MSAIFRNPEVKSVIIKLIVIQILFSGFIYIYVNHEIKKFNNTVITENTAILGKVASKHPELKEELVSIITKKAEAKEVSLGEKILNNYDYNTEMDVSDSAAFGGLYKSFSIQTTFITFIYIIPLLFLLLFEYRNIFKKVKKISSASEAVLSDDFNVELPYDDEGEFSILGHNFNAMAKKLKLSLESLNKEKAFLKNIISDISHQLKTPLSSLIAINEILLKKEDMEEKIRMDFLNKSISQLYRMEWLIINLLKIARLEANAIEFKKGEVPLVSCINKSLEALKVKYEEKHQSIEVSEIREAVYFIGDEEWTTEAVVNILKNCIEHTQEGGKIGIKMYETPLFSKLIIQDNGEGIDKSDLPHIFERFYKGSNSTKPESVGIGLALTKLIIEAQGGSISVESEKEAGTKFSITFLKGVI